MSSRTVLPKIPENASDEHDFHVLGSKRFEHMVRALHEAQPNMVGSHLYGPDGQAQFGADHVAYRRDGTTTVIEIGQSKAHRRFDASDIAGAAKDFLDYWDSHWKQKEVRRFILFVGCAIKGRTAHDEIITQTKEFEALGVEFSVWDANAIYDRLSERPGVVRAHLNQQWYERLFGEPVGPLSGLQGDLQRGDRGALQVLGYVVRLNKAESAELIELKRRARRGERLEVIQELEVALASNAASVTDGELRAERLRLLAGLLIQDGAFDRARNLLGEADALGGASDRQRAILMLEAVGPEALLADVLDDDHKFAEIRAVAQLRLGKPAAASAELDSSLAGDDPSAETLRIAALAKLGEGDRPAALELAKRAVARDAEARSCSQALALCHFHLALSPAAETMVGEWPQPIDLPLVGVSDEARQHLERAEAIFSRLMVGEELDDHRSMVMWHLATLACMPWRRSDTEARVTQLQSAGALPIPMMAWCASRGLAIDMMAATEACDARLTVHPDDHETLFVRVALSCTTGEYNAARLLLTNAKDGLIQAGHASIFDYWMAILAMEMRGSAAPAAIEGHPWLALRAAMAEPKRKKRLQRIGGLLQKELARDGDPRVILACTQILLERGKHKIAVKAGPYLLNRVGTAEAISIAAHAFYQSARVTEALDALSRIAAFPEKQLPYDLARLHAECLAVGGDLVGAREASLTIAKTTLRPADLWRSIEFHVATGAIQAALNLYDEHQALLAQPVPGHVLLASAVAPTHPEAAARITRRVAAEVPDGMVSAAFSLAAKLRLGEEQGILLGRMQRLGKSGAGGVQLVDIDSIIKMAKARREHAEKVYETYANGHAPIHFVARRALAANHLGPILSPPLPTERSGIFSARYGRRFEEDIWPAQLSNVTIFADLTALMSAQALEILDTAERALRPIMIAPDTVNAVMSMRSEIEVAQPNLVVAQKRVLAWVKSGKIAVATSAQQLDVFTTLWELQGGEPSSTLNFSRLAEILVGQLAPERSEAISRALGNAIEDPAGGATPCDGSVVNIDAVMAEALADVDLLQTAVAKFAITLAPEAVEHLQRQVADAETRAEVADSLTHLSARLARGLDDGSYKTVPVKQIKETDAAVRSFMHLVDAMRTGNAILWIDDRYVSSIQNAQFRVASTIEVLGVLQRHGRIARQNEIALRQRLRAARYQFLPIEGDEVATLLRQATKDGAVVETADLAILRRHMGEFLHHRRRLQWPTPELTDQEVRGEVPHLLDNGHELLAALVAIWNDERWSLEDCEAASEWAFEHLELGLFPLPILGPDDPRSDHLIGVHLGSLILGALQIEPGAGRSERQTAYLAWLWTKIIRNALRARPGFREPMEAMVEQHLVRTEGGAREEPLWLALAGRMLNAMPEPLRSPLLERNEMREAFGLAEHGNISVAGHDFDELEFWTAVASATQLPAPVVAPLEGKPATVSLREEGGRHLVLDIEDKKFRLDSWVWAIGQDDREICKEALSERAHRLDIGETGIEALCDALTDLSPIERIFHVQRQERASTASWYADLEEMVASRIEFKMMDLVPAELAGVGQFIRLADDLNDAAGVLVTDRGLAVALRRFGTLPIVPPRAIAAAVEAMSDAALATMLDEADADAWGPWSQLFVARIIIERPAGAGAFLARIQSWIDKALGADVRSYWRLYTSLARMMASEGLTQATWSTLSSRSRLSICWLHAGAVAEIVIGGGVKVDQLVGMVDEHRFIPPTSLLGTGQAFDGDVANPRHVNISRLLVHVAAPLLGPFAGVQEGRDWARDHLAALVSEGTGMQGARIAITEGGLARSDRMSSYLATDWSVLFEDVVPGTGGLFGRGLEALALGAIMGAGDSPGPDAGWPFVRFASGDTALPPEIANEARQVARLPEDRDARIMLAFARTAVANGWSEFREPVGARFESMNPETLGTDEDPMILLEIAMAHAMFSDDLLERTTILGGHLRRLAQFTPMRANCEAAALQFARGLQGQHAEAFVDVLADIWSSH